MELIVFTYKIAWGIQEESLKLFLKDIYNTLPKKYKGKIIITENKMKLCPYCKKECHGLCKRTEEECKKFEQC